MVPWLAMVGLVMAGWGPSRPSPITPQPPTESPIHPRVAVTHQGHNAEHTTLVSRTGSGSAARGDALDPALGAAAATAVQQVLTGTDQASARSRYINLALPEAVTWVGDLAIVDVAAVVLEGTDGRWDRPRAARYAVPLRVRAGVMRLLSVPWALPDPPQSAPGDTAFVPVPVNDQALTEAAGRALDAAGYRDVQVKALARDPGLPGVLEVEAIAVSPGEGEPRLQKIWVSDRPSPTVLGAYHPLVHSGDTHQAQPTVGDSSASAIAPASAPAEATQGGAR
ncbi:MAG: hypothetical protein ACRDYA_10345 [Egibacteraceae bacterium]